jgi:CHAT domain-containing protein/tetratricopeptide (TPR) repeat protein
MGNLDEAEPLYRRAIDLQQKLLAPDDPELAASMHEFGVLLSDRPPYEEAERWLREAIRIDETAFGPDDPKIADHLYWMAEAYIGAGRYDDAEHALNRGIHIDEQAFGPVSSQVADDLGMLGRGYIEQGNYAEAERALRRAFDIGERVHGPDDAGLVRHLYDLGRLYHRQGRGSEAEAFFRRALAIDEKVHGPESQRVAEDMAFLGNVLSGLGRFAEAEPLLRRALFLEEKAHPEGHAGIAGTLRWLGYMYVEAARYAEAADVLQRAQAMDERVGGAEGLYVAYDLVALVDVRSRQGLHGEAKQLLSRALSIDEKRFGPGSPEVAGDLAQLAGLDFLSGDLEAALAGVRRAAAIFRDLASTADERASFDVAAERRRGAYAFQRYLDVAVALAGSKAEIGRRDQLIAEAFEAAQLLQGIGTAQAVSRMGARFAAGDDALAEVVRARFELLDRWRSADRQLLALVGAPPEERDAGRIAGVRQELGGLEEGLRSLEARLAAEYPGFAEAAKPQSLSIASAQELLFADEALVVFAFTGDTSVAWIIRAGGVAMQRLESSASGLRDVVKDMRRLLDPDAGRGAVRPGAEGAPGAFDVALAHRLYAQLWAPLAPLLAGAKHVMIVADGPLQSLPFAVLVTQPVAQPQTDAEWRAVPWLIRDYALSTLPAVSSLRALRELAPKRAAGTQFVGIGDPLLGGSAAADLQTANLDWRGAVSDVGALRELAALPESADELHALAASMGAGDESLLLGAQATEGAVKARDLSNAGVLAFATHGLMAGELAGFNEPGLVLTPPAQPSEQDDGLLTASEIAQLQLNAGWVILSACNTAAADGTPGAEGLSGLAKAFFYAGARALLVSHWSVYSKAAVSLTTGTLAELAKDPTIGRAEALRRSMLALISTGPNPQPSYWAPFVIVGEGGAQVGDRN